MECSSSLRAYVMGRLLDAQAAHRDDTRGFQFTWASQQFGVPMGACHVIDVPFVFGVTDTPAGMFFTGGGEPARALAAEVHKVWGDFAHGRAVQGPAWKDTRRVRQFGPGAAEAAESEDEHAAEDRLRKLQQLLDWSKNADSMFRGSGRAGEVKEKVGDLTGNDRLTAEGRTDQATGNAEQAGDSARDAASNLGDAITRDKR